METFEFIKDCYRRLWSATGEYLEGNSISIVKSGDSSRDTNICFIDKIDDFPSQSKFFNENFNVNGLVFSSPSSRYILHQLSPRNLYAGKVGVLRSGGNAGSVNYNGIRVVKMDAENAKDYVDFYTSERIISRSTVVDSVKRNFEDLWVYLAYRGDTVIGSGTALRSGQSMFITDTIVSEAERNSGALSAVGQHSMREATLSGVSNFYAIVSSNYSQKVAEKLGFSQQFLLDLWISEERG